MNTFGKIFKIAIFGESHGQAIGVVIDGCPAGILLKEEDFLPDLERRKAGSPGTTLRKEEDFPLIKSGLLNQRTEGSPIMILFENREANPKEYQTLRDIPRPGHADFVAWQKFGGFNDWRGGGHFSGRLTLALVAVGVIAKKVLRPAVIEASLIEAGGSKDIEKVVQSAQEEGDSIGGIVECRVKGLPPGLGEPFFDSVESLFSHMVFSIPGIKGIEFGSGFASSRMRGSECNDIILDKKGKTKTNHAGGVNGGITNGNEIVFRVAVKPTSSIRKEQRTIHLKTGKKIKISLEGRHDVCFALRIPVILEAAAAIVLADLMLIAQKTPRGAR